MKLLTFIISALYFSFTIAQKTNNLSSCSHLKHQLFSKSSGTFDLRTDSIDILHTKLIIDVSNWNSRNLDASAQLTVKAKVNNITTINFDLLKLQIDSVKQANTTLSYTYNDTLLRVNLDAVLNQNQQSVLSIYYHGVPVQNSGDWGGFYWNNTYAYNIGVSFLEDVHNYGRVWFPCFDTFGERSSFEYFITTDNTRKAFCNGLLQSEMENSNGTTTWHWVLNQEIPSYLASMTVSDYATVEQIYNGIQSAPIPIQLAARAADTINLKNSFINLKNALQCYEESYAPYAFDRVGYCVTNFNAGAMEHATNITYMRNAVDGTIANETLMAHELSHHWWGNLITCASAEDMWINEGWASFSEALFTEFVYGDEDYKDYSRKNHDDVLRLAHINDGAYYPVSGVPSEQTYGNTVYNKGADMAHTIRGILGDVTFFSCLHNFMNDFAFQNVNSNQLENYLSTCSGKDLSSFFDTWIFEKGFHHYSLTDVNITKVNNLYEVEGSILQKLWENASFTNNLSIEISFFDENFNTQKQIVTADGECSNFKVTLNFEPTYIALDMDERIQDATVDKYKFIKQIGVEDFGLARVKFDVQSINDSVLLHATHHYIKPAAFKAPQSGIHLSTNRYWSIGGVWGNAFRANAIFRYNGSNNQTNGYLDNNFITNSEDSLVLLYKAKPSDEWSLVDSFTLNTQGSITDKIGYFEVYNVQQGDYVMAIYNKNIADNMEVFSPCTYTGINDAQHLNNLVKIYPIPTSNYIEVAFLDKIEPNTKIQVFNTLGVETYAKTILLNESEFKIDTQNWKKGIYIVSITNHGKIQYSKKIIIE